VPRTKHIANHGTNVGAAEQKRYEKFGFSDMSPVHNHFGDLSYLKIKNYNIVMKHFINSLSRVHGKNLRGSNGGGVVLYTREQYAEMAREFNLSPGEARGYSHGVLLVRLNNNRMSDAAVMDSSRIHQVLDTLPMDGYENNDRGVGGVASEKQSILSFAKMLLTNDRVFLVDKRSGSGFLSNEESMLPSPHSEVVTAPKGASCTQRCSSAGKKCFDAELEFVNNCESLLAHYPCEEGCGHQIGLEIPVYVSDSRAATFRQCLVTEQKMPKCTATHQHTSRLCACV
jgi:hypothetical protein